MEIKTLILDIENSPSLAHVWQLFKVNVSLNQLMETGGVICFAAKWLDEEETVFYSDHRQGHELMVAHAFDLLEEADVVVHYNGSKHDIPHLNREFLQAGLGPPAPFQEIDLLKVVKKKFNFTSNKMDHVTSELGIGEKVAHEGHGLWVKCLEGDPEAWERMEEYNRQDVLLTEELYKRVLPWIENHPHKGLYLDEEDVCPNCGGSELEKRGFSYTGVSKFQRFRCKGCGRWSRSGRRVGSVERR